MDPLSRSPGPLHWSPPTGDGGPTVSPYPDQQSTRVRLASQPHGGSGHAEGAARRRAARSRTTLEAHIMLAIILILLLLILLFGGLGVFVAKTFLWLLLVVLLVAAIASVAGRGRFGRRL
jgi:hypothetical protein